MTVPGASWVTKGYESWLTSLDNVCGFSSGIKSTSKTIVTLIGVTQEGKTTLALRLLDAIEPEKVGDALRGGRNLGQSATPGPIAYRAVSASGHPDYEAIRDSISRKFESYRARYEFWQQNPGNPPPFESPPEIAVPSDLPDCRFTIVDMAGFDGRESWAEHAAEHWTARADYTILVIRAEYISKFTTELFAFIRPRLVNRWIHSDSIMVVTTRAFEGKSDPDEKSLDWNGIRENRLTEFHEVLAGTSIERSQIKLFPVSFITTDTTRGQLAKAKEYTENSIKELKELLSSENTYTRISNAGVLRLDRKDSLQREINNHKKRRRDVNAKMSKLKIHMELLIELKNYINNNSLPAFSCEKFHVSSTNDKIHDSYSDVEPKRALEYYNKELNEFHKTLNNFISRITQKANTYSYIKLPETFSERISLETLAPQLGHKIHENLYKTNKYIFLYDEKVSGKKLYDLMVSREEIIRGQSESIATSYYNFASSKIHKVKSILEQDIGNINKELSVAQNEKRIIDGEIKAIKDKKRRLPRIPDLNRIMSGYFINDWNKTVSEANSSAENSNHITISFINLCAMEESLNIVTKRFMQG